MTRCLIVFHVKHRLIPGPRVVLACSRSSRLKVSYATFLYLWTISGRPCCEGLIRCGVRQNDIKSIHLARLFPKAAEDKRRTF